MKTADVCRIKTKRTKSGWKYDYLEVMVPLGSFVKKGWQFAPTLLWATNSSREAVVVMRKQSDRYKGREFHKKVGKSLEEA